MKGKLRLCVGGWLAFLLNVEKEREEAGIKQKKTKVETEHLLTDH